MLDNQRIVYYTNVIPQNVEYIWPIKFIAKERLEMKKIIGVQAELNVTTDDDIVRGIGKGIQNGSVIISDIIKELTPAITDAIKNQLEKRKKKTEGQE